MKCLRVSETADGYTSVVETLPDPVPRPGEVLVQIAASGVNRADLSQIAGRYPPPPGESEVLGMEIAGTVAGTGERIAALLAGGGHASLAAIPEGQMFPIPAEMSFTTAAGIPEAYLTAFVNLVLEGGLMRGGRALVHAGASGVGLASIQVARHLGASVAATTRTEAKIAAIEDAGAELAIDTRRENFRDVVERAWGKNAVDVVIDPVGADTLESDLAVLAIGGRIVFLSTMSGAKAELDISRLMGKRGRIIGSTLRSRSRDEKAAIVARFRQEILPGFDSGALSVPLDSVYPAARAAEAFTRMKRNENAGKIVIDWDGV